jgi:hypothetical protein
MSPKLGGRGGYVVRRNPEIRGKIRETTERAVLCAEVAEDGVHALVRERVLGEARFWKMCRVWIPTVFR